MIGAPARPVADARRPADAFSATEEAPATPGWVETACDAILDGLPDRPALRALRGRYLDGLATSLTAADRDRCRAAFLSGLEADGVARGPRDEIGHRLMALEAEIGERT